MRLTYAAAALLFVTGCSDNSNGGNRPPSGNPNNDLASTGPSPGSGDMVLLPPSQGDDMPSMGDMAMGPASGCQYPTSGYGTKVGDVLDPSRMYECFVPGGGDKTVKISPRDLFDCDGKLGINGILLDSGGVGCGGCEGMSMEMPDEANKNMWKELGIRAVLSVANPYTGSTGTIEDAKTWRDMYKLQDVAYVCAAQRNNYIGYGFFPSVPVVDPRTMKFYFTPTMDTFKDGSTKVVELAKMNKK